MKKYHIKKIIVALGFVLLGFEPIKAQQNIQFTQYIFNSLSVNPAYAGYKEEWFGQMALRAQWVGFEGAPKTGQISIDGIADPNTKRIGVGLQIGADKLGPQFSTSAYANIAYRLRLNEEDTQRLSFGLGLGVTNFGLDGKDLRPVDQGDTEVPMGQINSFIPDARFGVYYYNPVFYVGVSVMDLLSGNNNDGLFDWGDGVQQNIRRKRHFYLIAGTVNDLTDGVKIRPSILVKEDFKGPTSLDLNAMFIFNEKIWVGGSYRTGINLWKKDYREDMNLTNLNSVSAIAQFYVSNNLRIGYSYDFMLNGLAQNQSGTHEITLGLTFPRGLNRMLSPRFF